MATLLDFRRRIRSVKNTQQITRAMKFVAAARLRRAQEAAIAARPYAKELARMLRSVMSRIAEPKHPLLAKRSEERILALVLTGERGLAGAFNANILRKAQDFFRANKSKKISTIPVGKKGRDSLKKAGFTLIAEYVNVLARVDFGTAREIASLVTDLYAKEEIDSVYIVFSEFKTVMTPNLVVTKLLPLEAVQGDEESAAEGAGSQGDYIYEEPADQLLGKLLPRYVEPQILRAMLESSAAEHAARMTAMQPPTKPTCDLIEPPTLHMSKIRPSPLPH